ncbi:three component ABC system middle component [Luteibacter yeojuensis]
MEHRFMWSSRPSASPPSDIAFLVQNPALGAGALWRAAAAHVKRHQQGIPVALAFVVLPMVFHGPTLKEITSTRTGSGLARLTSKFKNREDDLQAVQRRALRMRPLSFDALALASAADLIRIDYDAATAMPVDQGAKPAVEAGSKAILDGAEKLGGWFAEHSLHHIAALLRLDF